MENWVSEELTGIDLGDERLNARSMKLLNCLQDKPGLSIPGACNGWAETQAAYRFFNNDKVTAAKILEPHITSTLSRICNHSVALCIEDTTFINHDGQTESSGLGPHSSKSEHGYFYHPLITFTPEKLCLGSLGARTWARDGKFGKRKGDYKKQPIETKESQRWIDGYQATCDFQNKLDDTELVYIADRESDIYELFVEGVTGSATWLIRAVRNRKTTNSNKIRDQLAKETALGEISLTLSRRKKRAQREAKLTVYARQLELLGPHRHQLGKLDNVGVSAILAVEESPPDNEEPIEWLLLTNRHVACLEQATESLQWYSCRWQIEIFFNVLKSGCQIEKMQLETRERLEAALALYTIVAWRLLYIRTLSRLLPDESCELVFETTEWQAIYAMTYKEKPPDTPLTLKEVTVMIAMAGGYLNRKNDPDPGVKTLWIGLQRLKDFLAGLEFAKKLGVL